MSRVFVDSDTRARILACQNPGVQYAHKLFHYIFDSKTYTLQQWFYNEKSDDWDFHVVPSPTVTF